MLSALPIPSTEQVPSRHAYAWYSSLPAAGATNKSELTKGHLVLERRKIEIGFNLFLAFLCGRSKQIKAIFGCQIQLRPEIPFKSLCKSLCRSPYRHRSLAGAICSNALCGHLTSPALTLAWTAFNGPLIHHSIHGTTPCRQQSKWRSVSSFVG